MSRGNTKEPAPITEKPRAIATVRRVDDPARLDALLAILRSALDARRRSGQG